MKKQQENIDLAKKLAKNSTKKDISNLIFLCTNGTKNQQSDSIKTVYELAQLRPSLFPPHIQALIDILPKANNRMIWGVLQFLNIITDEKPQIIIKNLTIILEASDISSVIAKDNMMAILTKLSAIESYYSFLSPIILQRLSHSAPNQFPTYVELVAQNIKEKAALVQIINERLKDISSSAKQNRLKKILNQLNDT